MLYKGMKKLLIIKIMTIAIMVAIRRMMTMIIITTMAIVTATTIATTTAITIAAEFHFYFDLSLDCDAISTTTRNSKQLLPYYYDD